MLTTVIIPFINAFTGKSVGELAMSRALGDFQYKDPARAVETQMVTCVPDIAVHKRSSDDAVMVLACDGVWDVMENSDSISFLLDIVDATSEGITAEAMAESLVDVSLAAGSTDNISALIVRFNGQQVPKRPGGLSRKRSVPSDRKSFGRKLERL